MKINSVEKIVSEIVMVDEGDYTTYRRNSCYDWEVLKVGFWEPEYSIGQLEKLYQEYKMAKEVIL